MTAGLLVAACAGGGVTTPGDDEEEPGLDRSELEVTVRVSEEDGELASALGWEDRRVPGARVTLMSETATNGIGVEDSVTGETDAAGSVRLDDLLPGTTYRVSVARPLTAGEVAQVQDERSGVRVLGGGTKARSGLSIEVAVDANRTDGLVISEVASVDENGYKFGSYVELYNNSDRAITLDGRVIGRALAFGKDLRPARPCAETRSFQSDPSGIWSQFFQAFPGSGGEHTVAPGETLVVATDAIDHRAVDPIFPDLRDADFEFPGPSDVDNPDVPNMNRVGLRPWVFGHGLDAQAFRHSGMRIFLTQRIDVDALQQGRPDPADDDIFIKFPAEKVVDVTTTVNGISNRGRGYCGELLHDRYEELAKVFTVRVAEEFLVHHRRVAGETDGGRPILLDTNTSAVDFRWGEMTPGELGVR